MPQFGTWTQPDPKSGGASKPINLNRYVYAGADPANASDRNGREWSDIFGEFDVLGTISTVLGDLVTGDSESAVYDALSLGTGFLVGAGCEAASIVDGFTTTAACALLGAGVAGYADYVFEEYDLDSYWS